jgi:hypothetical protein
LQNGANKLAYATNRINSASLLGLISYPTHKTTPITNWLKTMVFLNKVSLIPSFGSIKKNLDEPEFHPKHKTVLDIWRNPAEW